MFHKIFSFLYVEAFILYFPPQAPCKAYHVQISMCHIVIGDMYKPCFCYFIGFNVPLGFYGL